MKVALENGVHLKSGVKVKSVNIEKAAIVLENGEMVTADLIIAADGVHVSRSVRKLTKTSHISTTHFQSSPPSDRN